MKNIFKIVWMPLIFVFLFSCKNNLEQMSPERTLPEKNLKQKKYATDISNYIGNYVSDSYIKRNEGFDWVSIAVTQISENTLHLSVRSRIDKKKPTCTFDTNAIRKNDKTFMSQLEGKDIEIIFKDNTISIQPKKPEDKDVLYYYCSGGATVAGTYSKIDEPLDETQLDSRVFVKFLHLQDVFFDVSSKGKGSIQQVTIQPIGLKNNAKRIIKEIMGNVTDAEIEDLDSDGYPELLIYYTSAGSGSYGSVLGYSVNDGKSLSEIYFPPVSDNSKVNKGYMGHDEFSIIEGTLAQRFKTYNANDVNSNPTGVIRQIEYKLVPGEASKKFIIDRITEFNP